MKWRGLGAVALLVLLGASATATAAKLSPVDQTVEEPSFQKFRDRLVQAVEEHDAAFVIGVLDPEIKLSFGDDQGVEDFKKLWEPENPDSPLWPTLQRLLHLGGAFYPGEVRIFCAPYVFTQWPQEYFPYDYAAIVAADVPARAQPEADAPVLFSVSYEIVELLEPDKMAGTEQEWIRIHVPGRPDAYVPAEAVYSPIGYRACFEQRQGGWTMTSFLAGD